MTTTKELKRAHLGTYMDKEGIDHIYFAVIGPLLHLAIDDGVTDLIVSKSEYHYISRWIIGNSIWNWDKKTFCGMNLIVEQQ